MAETAVGGRNIQTTFEMSRKDMIRFCHVVTRGCRILFLVSGGVLFVLGVTSGDLFTALFPAVVFGSFYGLVELKNRQRVDKGFGYLRSGFLDLGEDSFVLRTAPYSASYDWSMFESVRRRRGFWLLRMKAGGYLPFTEATFDPADAERFEALLRAKGIPLKH
jgi:hypothetical protein